MFENKEELYTAFLSPSPAWRGKPFWSWNGELEEAELCRQVEVLKEMGFGGHFMHSRSGLITEYLGEEWFRLINAVADKSEAENMEAWLYDEDRWPSGSAGGKATKEEKYRIRSLRLKEFPPEKYAPDPGDIALFAAALGENGISLEAYEKLTGAADVKRVIEEKKYGEKLRVLAFDIVIDPDDSNFNGSGYLNTMDKKATEHFIELTHEQYKAHAGRRLGESIKGIFTDEPHRGKGLDDLSTDENGVRKCSIAWTDDFFAEFEKRYVYDIREKLPEVFYRYKNTSMAKCKIDWFDLACDLFNERFAQPINNWCGKNGIVFTGHVLHEDELINQTVANGSLMRFYENMGAPGVDTLGCRNYNFRIVKQLASAARQTGKHTLLSELYGCTGWDFDFTGHKLMGTWQAFFGINLRCPHLSWYTMEGEAKRDYPASILHQAPWYKDYYDIETYFARFGMLTSGEALCDTLVISPIESVWGMAYPGWTNWLFSRDDGVDALEKKYEELFYMLMGAQIDFDYGEEAMMARLAHITSENGIPVLKVGEAAYKTVVVSGLLTMRESTLRLLREFRAFGGKVIFAGEAPAYLGGEPSELPEKFAADCIFVPAEKEALAAAVRNENSPLARVKGKTNDKIYIRRFAYANGVSGVAVFNADYETGYENILVDTGLSGELAAEEWELMSGEKLACPSAKGENGTLCFAVSLAPGSAKTFILSPAASNGKKAEKKTAPVYSYDLSGLSCAYTLAEENVCVLDRVLWRVNGGEWSAPTEVLRADRAVRDFFGIERRGGQMVQPWYSRLYKTDVLGKVEMKYIFFADKVPAGDVYLAAERPEIMHYEINGIPLTPDGDFWVDVCFKRMKLPSGAIRQGRNEITVSVDFTQNVNFEILYLLGVFGVKTDGAYARLTPLPETISFGNAADHGLPFYGADITYLLPAAVFAGARERARNGEKIFLRPEGVKGSLIKYASSAGSGKAHFRPYKADITASVLAEADVELTLVGNRRNTFGTMHMLPAEHDGSSPGDYVTEGECRSEDFALPPVGIQRLIVTAEK